MKKLLKKAAKLGKGPAQLQSQEHQQQDELFESIETLIDTSRKPVLNSGNNSYASLHSAGTTTTNMTDNVAMANTTPLVRSTTSPPLSIVMPKPRRFTTPTRSILGRFENDKTEVENEDEFLDLPDQPQKHRMIDVAATLHYEDNSDDEISPIMLPTSQEPSMSHNIVKPIARKPLPLEAVPPQQQYGSANYFPLTTVPSYSTVISDSSSRVYESALDSQSDSEAYEGQNLANFIPPPDINIVKRKPTSSTSNQQAISSIIPHHFSKESSQQKQQQQQQQLYQNQRPFVPEEGRAQSQKGQSSTSSAAATPLLNVIKKRLPPPNIPLPDPTSSGSQQQQRNQQQQNQQQQKEKEATGLDFKSLQEIKKSFELMEQQQRMDRQEMEKKERQSASTLEALKEKHNQLSNTLKEMNEEKYRKKLQIQQLEQLKQQFQKNAEEEREQDDNTSYPIYTEMIQDYYEPSLQPQQQQQPYQQPQQHKQYQTSRSRRTGNRCRSEEPPEHQYPVNETRSPSRASYHNNIPRSSSRASYRNSNNNSQYMPSEEEEEPIRVSRNDGRNGSTYRNDRFNNARSRRSSGASTKSMRYNPSPSTTIVDQGYGNSRRGRSRTRSTGEEWQHQDHYYPTYEDEQDDEELYFYQQYQQRQQYLKEEEDYYYYGGGGGGGRRGRYSSPPPSASRRSRSAGTNRHANNKNTRRPMPTRHKSIYNDEFEEDNFNPYCDFLETQPDLTGHHGTRGMHHDYLYSPAAVENYLLRLPQQHPQQLPQQHPQQLPRHHSHPHHRPQGGGMMYAPPPPPSHHPPLTPLTSNQRQYMLPPMYSQSPY